MRKMKLFLAVILGAFALFSCSDDDTPTVSFDSANYLLMANEDLNVTVKFSEPVKSDMEIPLTFSGEAQKGTDYIVSAEKLTVKAGSTTAKLVISPKENYDEGKSIIISLGTVAGFDFGKNQVATITVSPKDKMIYTFTKEYQVLESRLEVKLELLDKEGNRINIAKDLHIPFVFDETIENAAVKGTHFAVKDDVTEFVVKAGTNVGKVVLEYLQNEDIEKNRIKIDIPDLGPAYAKGGYESTVIKIYGGTVGKLFGTWECTEFANVEWIKSYIVSGWSLPASDVENLPEDVVGERISFEAGEIKDKITIDMEKDLAMYFKDCEIEHKGLETFRYQDLGMYGNKRDVEVFYISQANVKFSASEESLRKAEIAFRVKEVDGEDVLEIVIYDFEPIDFYQKLYEMVLGWGGELPIKDSGMLMRYNFKRVTEE